MGEFQKEYLEWKIPYTKEYILYDYVYRKFYNGLY